MTDDVFTGDILLLSLCAILHSFDRKLLLALANAEEAELAPLLASEFVVSTEHADTYRLREDVRANVLARLRALRPLDELDLHTRVFEYFLRQIERSGSSVQLLENEENCFYHLDKLFFLLLPRLEWRTII
jgi:hypothetical protein